MLHIYFAIFDPRHHWGQWCDLLEIIQKNKQAPHDKQIENLGPLDRRKRLSEFGLFLHQMHVFWIQNGGRSSGPDCPEKNLD